MAASQVANIEGFLNKRPVVSKIFDYYANVFSSVGLSNRWLSRLENGDVGLEVELTSAIASKEPTYGPRNCESYSSAQSVNDASHLLEGDMKG